MLLRIDARKDLIRCDMVTDLDEALSDLAAHAKGDVALKLGLDPAGEDDARRDRLKASRHDADANAAGAAGCLAGPRA